MLPTLADVLDLPALRRADPHVRAAADKLGRAVRWVHVSEVADIAHLLEGGEFILTTGIANEWRSVCGETPTGRPATSRT